MEAEETLAGRDSLRDLVGHVERMDRLSPNAVRVTDPDAELRYLASEPVAVRISVVDFPRYSHVIAVDGQDGVVPYLVRVRTI